MDALDLLRLQARANRLANRRLHAALQPLGTADFHAPRTGFFPSLAATLNHLLAVDLYYIGALHREPGLPARYGAFEPAQEVEELARRQALCDERLIAWCEAADAARLEETIELDRGSQVDHDRAGLVLAHLFMHQTHHRGQAHAMLSSTSVAPPQLDEFLLASDASRRAPDMAVLGWTEAGLYGPAGPGD